MKKLIHEVKESSGSSYQLWAELTPCPNPKGYKQLQFTSVWTGAKNPEAPQRKGDMLLSPEAINNLKELLASK